MSIGGARRTLCANYYKMAKRNFERTDGRGATGIVEIYEQGTDIIGESDEGVEVAEADNV